jgi:hypothetical protein
MRPMQRVISAGFAIAAIASASVPALAWTVWPDVDFEWYANAGHAVATRDVQISTAPTAPYRSAARDERSMPLPAPRIANQGPDEIANASSTAASVEPAPRPEAVVSEPAPR